MKKTVKKAVKKKVVKKPVRRKKPAKKVTKITRKMVKALETRIEKQIKKTEKALKSIQCDFNVYAPGSWDVRYVYDAKNDSVKPQFFKLSPRARAKNRERILSLPLTHEETVEEVMEKLKFKK